MSAPKTNYGKFLFIYLGILLAGCRNTNNDSLDYKGHVTWDALKTSLRAPGSTLNPNMRIRCIVLDGRSFKLQEGLHDWETVEKLRDSLGNNVIVENACTLEGLKEGSVETGYYLNPVNPKTGPRILHGLRFQTCDVRVDGRELSCKAILSFGRHQTDAAWHNGHSGLDVVPITSTVERTVEIRMVSNQVQAVDLHLGSYFALIEILDAP